MALRTQLVVVEPVLVLALASTVPVLPIIWYGPLGDRPVRAPRRLLPTG